MKIRNISVVVLVSMMLFGCGSSKQPVVTNAALDAMMEQETFQIMVTSAEPQVTSAMAKVASSGMMGAGNTVSRIDLTGQGYFIKLEGEKVSANLPYYGERQMGGGIGSDAGITFDTTASDVKITKDEEKKSYDVTFNVRNSSESFSFTIAISAGLSSSTSVTSSQRNLIRYSGKVSELVKSE